MVERSSKSAPRREVRQRPFRRAVLRGLAVVLPPLLTIVVFIWAWTTIERYVLRPIEAGAHKIIIWRIVDVRGDRRPDVRPHEFAQLDGRRWYVKLESGRWIPKDVYDAVDEADEQLPKTSEAFYERYVQIRYLRRSAVIPVFLAMFVLFLYMIGKFLAAGAGRMMVNLVEGLIQRLPVIRNVYSSVKQVTDFVFSEREIEFNRVVAVEYPRKGVWSLGFVTGESMLDIRSAANEPVLSVLMPTSPMPATGFTISVPKSETIDVDITIDQAIQFVVSCGVVVPAQQQQREMGARISAEIARRVGANQDGNAKPPSTPARLPTVSAPEESNGQEASGPARTERPRAES